MTLVIAGAGRGKTTLMVQAMEENRIAPRGRDVWLCLDAADSDGTALGEDLLTALGSDPRSTQPTAATVADALWGCAPEPVCLVVDDAHVLPPGSAGHRLLAELVGALPVNAHLVIASRTDPAIPIARLAVSGELQRVTEAQLLLDDDELSEIAHARSVDPTVLAAAGGWPAMVELLASAGTEMAVDYVWQEVIEPLDRGRRHVLATLVELGGGDDALLGAALGSSVDLAADLATVPLIDVHGSGWHRPHDLWQPMARLRLTDAERDAILRRAVRHLTEQRRFDEAIAVLRRGNVWDEAPAVLRASCIEWTHLPSAEGLGRWLAMCPPAIRQSPGALLAEAVRTNQLDPDRAVGPLQRAVSALRSSGDFSGELGALAHLGGVAWWTRNWDAFVASGRRINEIAESGSAVAASVAAIGRAVGADLTGSDAAMAAALGDPALDDAPGESGAFVGWLRANDAFLRGEVEMAQAISERHLSAQGAIVRFLIVSTNAAAAYFAGALDEIPSGIDPAGEARHNLTQWNAETSRMHSFAGDVERGRNLLALAQHAVADDWPTAAVCVALAGAALHVAVGDETAAATTLRAAIERHGLDAGSARRPWREGLCLSYVLLPESRHHWDTATLSGAWARCRDLCAAIIAGRQGRRDAAAAVELGDLNVARRLLHHRFAAELSVLLALASRPEGERLLDALGAPGRVAVRELAAAAGEVGAAARSLLAVVPAIPPVTVTVGVLGPLTIAHDGEAVDHPAMRRERVRALLAYLVVHRRARRAAVVAALWPDLDERAGANNLRVTLNHLMGMLEPWRQEREPSYLVRTDPTELRLVDDPLLRIDADEFDAAVAAGRQAEADGAPSVALDAYLSAVAAWRGEPFADVADQPWLDLERERLRSAYVGALQRAAQLLAGRGRGGDLDHADELARRAIAVDPWAESAYGVLISTAIGRGDRAAARRMLDRALAVAAELAVEPADEIKRLARRLAAG